MPLENISTRQQIRESILTTSRVMVDASECQIAEVVASVWNVDGVTDVVRSDENDGRYDIAGVCDGDEFRLLVTARP